MVVENIEACFINFIAKLPCLPNGGLPIVNTFGCGPNGLTTSSSHCKKSCLITPLHLGSMSIPILFGWSIKL